MKPSQVYSANARVLSDFTSSQKRCAFYCTPASCVENLSRWYWHGALWSLDDAQGNNDGLIDEIAMAMTRKQWRLARQVPRTRQQWGLDFVGLASEGWRQRWTAAQRPNLMTNAPFARLVRALDDLADASS
jgi:hypothetical protein